MKPGDEVIVLMPEESLEVQFVDIVSREAVRGVEFEAWYPSEIRARTEVLQTDGDGVAAIAPTSFPLLIRGAGAASRLQQLTVLDETAREQEDGPGGKAVVRIGEIPPTRRLLIGVRTCLGQLRLLDALTAKPVEAQVRILSRSRVGCPGGEPAEFSRCSLQSPRSAFGDAEALQQTSNGLIGLPCHLTKGANPNGRLELVVVAAGYRPEWVELPSDVSVSAGSVQEVRLTPCPQRSLTVLLEDGTPYDGQIEIYSPLDDLLCWQSDGEANGINGPFDWPGGDLLVSDEHRKVWKWTIPQAELASQVSPTLRIPGATGEILVEGIPPEASKVLLVAKRGISGERAHIPSSIAEGSITFSALPAGSYLVGPPEWVDAAMMQSVTFLPRPIHTFPPDRPLATRIQVDPGSRVVVRWMDCWAAGRIVEGNVRIDGLGRFDPFLVPFHNPGCGASQTDEIASRTLVFGRTKPMIGLRPDGGYTIAADEPLPEFMAVCLAEDTAWGGVQGLLVLDTIAPGESIVIPVASVELRWKGPARAEPLPVRFLVQTEAMRHPLRTHLQDWTGSWHPQNPMRIDGIPLHVRQLEVGGRVLPVELRSGKVMNVDVDLARLAPLRR